MKEIKRGIVEIKQGDSISQLESFDDGYLDFAYLDADHRFQYALDDLDMLYHKVKPGGWICGHDYCEICDFGVIRAVTLFCYKYGLHINYLTDEPPIPVLHKPRPNIPDSIAFNSFAIKR
jgi:hypothetical protein